MDHEISLNSLPTNIHINLNFNLAGARQVTRTETYTLSLTKRTRLKSTSPHKRSCTGNASVIGRPRLVQYSNKPLNKTQQVKKTNIQKQGTERIPKSRQSIKYHVPKVKYPQNTNQSNKDSNKKAQRGYATPDETTTRLHTNIDNTKQKRAKPLKTQAKQPGVSQKYPKDSSKTKVSKQQSKAQWKINCDVPGSSSEDDTSSLVTIKDFSCIQQPESFAAESHLYQDLERQRLKNKQLQAENHELRRKLNQVTRASSEKSEIVTPAKSHSNGSSRMFNIELNPPTISPIKGVPANNNDQLSWSNSNLSIPQVRKASPEHAQNKQQTGPVTLDFRAALREQQDLAEQKHKQQLTLLKLMYANQVISPKSYSKKMSRIHHSFQLHKQLMQKINRFYAQIHIDKDELEQLALIEKEKRWSDGLELLQSGSPDKIDRIPLQEEEECCSEDQDQLSPKLKPYSNNANAQTSATLEHQSPKHLQRDSKEAQNDDEFASPSSKLSRIQQIFDAFQTELSSQGKITSTTTKPLPSSFRTDPESIKSICASLCEFVLNDAQAKRCLIYNILNQLPAFDSQILGRYRLTHSGYVRFNGDPNQDNLQQHYLNCLIDALAQSVSQETSKFSKKQWAEFAQQINNSADNEYAVVFLANCINRIIEWSVWAYLKQKFLEEDQEKQMQYSYPGLSDEINWINAKTAGDSQEVQKIFENLKQQVCIHVQLYIYLQIASNLYELQQTN